MDFYSDLFTPDALIGSLAQAQFIPGRLGADGVFSTKPQPGTTFTYIVEPKNSVGYTADTVRGAPSRQMELEKREGNQFPIPAMQPYDIPILADQVLNAGSPERGRLLVTTLRDDATKKLRNYVDFGHEYRRVAVLNSPSNVLGSAPAAVQVKFAIDDEAMRAEVFKKVTVPMETALDGTPYTGLVAYCEDDYWEALLKSKTINATYMNYAAAAEQRGAPADQFPYGGVTWKRYRSGGGISITSGQAKVIPLGVSDLFVQAFAPDDTMQSVGAGELGQPYYLNVYPLDDDKGIRIKIASHVKMLCTRPPAVMTLKLTT